MKLNEVFTIREFTGWHMLGVLFLFFGTIIAANMTLTWFALGSWSGLVAKNGYVASLEFNQREAEIEKQKKLGWKSQLRTESGHLLFSIKNANGEPLSGLKLTASAGRPTTEKWDMTLNFRETDPGRYLAARPKQPGQWLVDLVATSTTGEKYRQKFRISITDKKVN